MFNGSRLCELCEGNIKPTGDNHCLGLPSSKGLSGGAIAGIVIAVIVVLAVAGFLVYWFVFRKSTSKKTGRVPMRESANISL